MYVGIPYFPEYKSHFLSRNLPTCDLYCDLLRGMREKGGVTVDLCLPRAARVARPTVYERQVAL